MQRDLRAYLSDVLECCDAIEAALDGIDLDAYKSNRLIRSAVEREFTIIGEAVSVLSREAPDVFDSITQARRIVDFRNQLTHEYPSISDTVVWDIAESDIPLLRQECAALFDELGESGA